MTKLRQYISKGPDDLEAIAEALLQKFPDRRVFAFYGEMGAGKTTFIQALCRLLRVEDTVSSPTFAIVNVYRTADDRVVNHFDCYRMKSVEEAFDIGYEDYFYGGDHCFIEWPEIIGPLIPDDAVRVDIRVDKENGERAYSF